MTRESERRRHKRHGLACPTTLVVQGGKHVKAKTTNISDSGACIEISPQDSAAVEGHLSIQLALPRKTANTYMLEDFISSATVVRRIRGDKQKVGLAIQFVSPLKLDIEV